MKNITLTQAIKTLVWGIFVPFAALVEFRVFGFLGASFMMLLFYTYALKRSRDDLTVSILIVEIIVALIVALTVASIAMSGVIGGAFL